MAKIAPRKLVNLVSMSKTLKTWCARRFASQTLAYTCTVKAMDSRGGDGMPVTNGKDNLFPLPLVQGNDNDLNTAAQHGASIITNGGLIATPTDTVYGIAGDAQNTDAISKIYQIKGRISTKPIAICVSSIQHVYEWGKVHVPETLLQDLLPGPVTLVFERQPKLNPNLNPNTNLIGIRIPDHNFIRRLAEFHKGPVALTSANFSAEPSTLSVDEFKGMWPLLHCIFDGGRLSSNDQSEIAARAGSTVIDLSTQGTFKIIRKGTAYETCVSILKNKFNLREL